MFGPGFFGAGYFGPGYWGPGGTTSAINTGGGRYRNKRQQAEEDDADISEIVRITLQAMTGTRQ